MSQDATQATAVIQVPIDQLKPNPHQPRQHLGDLRELAASIAEHGILQPITVEQNFDDTFTLIAGHRRAAAAKRAGLQTVPAILREGSDAGVLALLENLQRVDLVPLEIAEALRKLLDKHGETQDSLAQKLGISRDSIARRLRLLSLPPSALSAMQVDTPRHPALSESAAMEIARLGIFAKISTAADAEDWIDRCADSILWGPNWLRSHRDVRRMVDWWLSIARLMCSFFETLPAAQSQAFAEALLADLENAQEKTANHYAATMFLYLKPDFKKLTKAQREALDEAANRIGFDEADDEEGE